MNGQRLLVRVLIVGLLLVLMIGSGPPPARAADFDQDGYADLAIGVYWETVGDVFRAGAVNVLYGTSVGITAANDQLWTQDDLSPHYSMNADYFGQELAAGDFDGDRYDDLAIGVPFEELVLQEEAGIVHALYGSSAGLTAAGTQSFCLEAYTAGDRYGMALTAGDFDGDGFDELAVGIPGEDLYSWFNIGAVEILYGWSGGSTAGQGETISGPRTMRA